MSVDLTIYKTGNNVDAANRASINIKNNNEKTQKTGFDGVIVSGMEVDTKKLDKNTYTSLIKQADDVKSQIMQSASDAKANLKALFNRLSGADAVKIDEDGFNLNDATPDDCVNIIERIKIELAAHCDTYTGDMSGIDVSKIEKVVGSAGMAQQVAANMQDTGLPLTDDNISDMAESLSGMENGSLSEDTKNYLVKNNMQPTIKNIQIAQAASKGFGDKMQTLSRQELEQLMPQIKEIIGKAKLEVNDNNINNAITFISQDIPVTEQNLVYKNQLDMINLDYDETSLKIAQGMADGSKAEEVSLINKIEKYKKLVILKAFTKMYAMAGIRLGYIICSCKEFHKKIKACIQPWSVSVTAQMAGCAALREKNWEEKTREYVKKEKGFRKQTTFVTLAII